MTWPNLFIPGAAKSGTTSLYAYLAQHPEVFMSADKEPHFFSRIQPSRALAPHFKHVSDEGRYLKLFAGAGDARVVGEASTSYLWDARTPERIHRRLPGVRFVVLLRDPVRRAFSHYLDDVREGTERRDFRTAIEQEIATPAGARGWGRTSLYVDAGFYAKRLARYLELFGRGAVLTLVFEEFIADPRAHLRRVFAFLGVSEEPAATLSLDVHNPYARPRGAWAARLLGSGLGRRLGRLLVPAALRPAIRGRLLTGGPKPQLDDSSRVRLVDLYRDEVAACGELLGRDLPWESAR